jgi:lipopolysaccharide/colanic/teichoic acid biosynthesis glycosyltransferase
VLTLPLMLLVALIVRLDSPGPVVFRQVRIGRNGRLFRFAKFRTLYVDARERWPHLYAYRYTADEVAALHFKLRNDPRVTRVGRWLRTSTLDELPNLWNVLVGDVALVGPRPEIPEMLPSFRCVPASPASRRCAAAATSVSETRSSSMSSMCAPAAFASISRCWPALLCAACCEGGRSRCARYPDAVSL